MNKAVLSLVIALAAAGCGGDDSQQQVKPDATPGPPCTGAVYDVCVNAADCMSQNCHFYSQENITVCTQACNAQNPCPVDSTGQPGKCNNKGECKPAVANNCSL